MKLGDPVTPKTARALVTGAGSGIGASYARHLAELGYDLVLVGRDIRKLAEQADRVRRTADVDIELLPADLAAPEGLSRIIERAVDDPALEIVVNSAGIAGWGPTLELDADALQREVDLNVQATFRITVALTRAMHARGRGAVINVASLSALVGFPYLATYTGTKAFLLTFSEALHEELRGTGVVVQALLPGFTRTDMFAVSGADVSKIPGFIWMEADAVVRASLSALRRRKAVCVPGIRNKLAMLQMRFTPRWIMRKFMKFQLGGFETMRIKKPGPNPTESTPGGTSTPIVSASSGETPRSGDGSHSVHTTSLKAVS